MKLILFDMDGTIIDPKLGFVRCINYALQEMDEIPVLEASLEQYIGPPLDFTFQNLLNNSDPIYLQQCVAKYRERYLDVGWQENHLYPGIEAVLQTLHANKMTLAICTSRRTDLAQKIINHYDFNALFSAVYGADIGIKKSSLVAQLIEQGCFASTSWLIGDRSFDIEAAQMNGLSSVAVLWGYGSKQELDDCAPTYMASKPEQLPELINQNF